jgi:hypothetical protein
MPRPCASRRMPTISRCQCGYVGWKRSVLGTEPGERAEPAGRGTQHTEHRRGGSELARHAPRVSARRQPHRDPQDLIVGDRGVDRPESQRITHRRGKEHTKGPFPLPGIGKNVSPRRIIGVAGGEQRAGPSQPIETHRNDRDRHGRRHVVSRRHTDLQSGAGSREIPVGCDPASSNMPCCALPSSPHRARA